MSLKNIIGQKILDEVIRSVKVEKEWKVLVVDQLAMRVISTCCQMKDIVMEGITIVEDLTKGRQSLPLESVYFITPTDDSVSKIIDDFKDNMNPRYKAVHIFFTGPCPTLLFEKLAKGSNINRRIKTLKEVNIAFLPTEGLVFSLDNPDALAHLYSPNIAVIKDKRPACIEQIAEQVATLCASLGEYPSIRYRSQSQLSLDVAQATLDRLTAYKADDPNMGEGPHKQKSQLLILDRGFDLVSPLLHELTYQAMAYDLIDIQNDVYKYEVQSGGEFIVKESLLNENDELWVTFRHKHIANVLRDITTMVRDFSDSKRLTKSNNEKMTIKDLSLMLKKMPQYQKELSKYSVHLNLAEECMKIFNANNKTVENLVAVEQDLATGVDKDGEKISKDHMRAIVPVLLDKNISENNKLRIILLYAIMKQGISEESMNKLLEHAKITNIGKNTINNMSHLGVPIVSESGKKKALPIRKERTEETFQLSRYVPYVKDIMEDSVEGKLDSKMFPFLMTRESVGLFTTGAASARKARFGNWHSKDKAQTETREVPRLIVFVVGGVAFSESRCAYEVSKANNAWEVLIGGTEQLTPTMLLYRTLGLA